MTRWRFITRSLWHHWRLHLSVALGVMVGTAVLSGALVVGDSVRDSLRHLALDRLGRIDAVLLTDRFFRVELADELSAFEGFQAHYEVALPAILLQGSFERPAQGESETTDRRANRVQVLGVDHRFWSAGDTPHPKLPESREVVLNRSLASALKANVGDEVILRISQSSDIPADSPLGRKSGTISSARLTVCDIIENQGLGRFGMSPSQQLPLNAYVTIGRLQELLDEPGSANAIFVLGTSQDAAPDEQATAALGKALRPTLDDYGLQIERTDCGYFQITSRRMMLDPAVEQAALDNLADRSAQAILTYLANALVVGEARVPYSTITALDFSDAPPLGPWLDADGNPLEPLADDEIALNVWAADRLHAKVGDTVAVTYFEPESTHGEIREATVSLRLAAILPLSGAAADPDLTPELEGVTDQSTMADWDPPFPFDARAIGDEDEAYWDQYRATPKAFVSLARGREPWGSRFGRTTSVRFAPPEDEFTPQQAAARLDLSPEALGFVFQPLKRQAFEAAKGTTPFNLLFLGFSMFLIGAAVMLVALLYQLGIEQRTGEVGILLAEGFTPGAVQRIFTGEGMVTAVLGGAAGVALGIFYAWAMITGLQTLWLDAITTPFLNVAVNPWSLVIGYAASVLISVVAIYVSLRRLRRMSVSGLLALRSEPPQGPVVGEGRGAQFLTGGCLVLAVVAAIATRGLGGEAQAFAFFSSGVLVLTALLIAVRRRLRRGDTGSLATPDGWALARFAVRNGARNPGRSTLTIALVASASFLIVAISAFRRDSPGDDAPRDSGTGGFQLVAESDQPIFADLATVEGRDELGFSASDEEQLKSVSTYSLRVRQGDDASCLNLYQPRQPKVLGVSARLIERGGFAWHAAAERDGAKVENPWTLLEEDLGKTDDGRTIVPVVIDRDTAMYSLHLWSGVGQIYELPDGHGGMIPLQVVGLLVNSVFQGDLLISDAAFRRHFPQISGYRFFLFDVIPSKELATPAALPELNKRDDTASRPEGPEALKRRIETVSGILETRLKNSGLDVQRSRLLLEGFMAVQNTYLSMFQSLGGLGLLLGTFGLAAVQLRNILQRRGELALLRATGFRRQRLARLVLYENLALLLGGLGIGTLAAVLAVGPHWLSGGASVPWLDLALTLGVVALVGVGVSLWVVRAMLRTELIPALRGD